MYFRHPFVEFHSPTANQELKRHNFVEKSCVNSNPGPAKQNNVIKKSKTTSGKEKKVMKICPNSPRMHFSFSVFQTISIRELGSEYFTGKVFWKLKLNVIDSRDVESKRTISHLGLINRNWTFHNWANWFNTDINNQKQ